MNNKEITIRFLKITEKLLNQYGVKAEYKDHKAFDDHSITFVTDGDDYLSFYFAGENYHYDGTGKEISTNGNHKFSRYIKFNTQKECLRFILDYFNITPLRISKKLSKSLNEELKINALAKPKRIKL